MVFCIENNDPDLLKAPKQGFFSFAHTFTHRWGLLPVERDGGPSLYIPWGS